MDDDDTLPPAGPKQLPPHAGEAHAEPPTGSTATNGHWLHDDSGPTTYVGAQPRSVTHLSEILGAKVPGLRCTVEADQVYIDGRVDSDAQAREILQMVAELEPGLRVTSRLSTCV